MDTAKGGSRVCRAAREDLHRTMRPKGGQKEGGQKRWSENNRTGVEARGDCPREAVGQSRRGRLDPVVVGSWPGC